MEIKSLTANKCTLYIQLSDDSNFKACVRLYFFQCDEAIKSEERDTVAEETKSYLSGIYKYIIFGSCCFHLTTVAIEQGLLKKFQNGDLLDI